ncbi:hypothetical protein J6O48_02620 [bacterium]|nr:hypothetical protein [bacterium]
MFCSCTNFNCDLSKWNVSKGELFTHMFDFCPINKNVKYKPAMLRYI